MMDSAFEQYRVEEYSLENAKLLIDNKEIIYHGTIEIVTNVWRPPYGQGRMGSRIEFQTTIGIDFLNDLFEKDNLFTLIVFPAYGNRMIFRKTRIMTRTIKKSPGQNLELSIAMSGKQDD